MATYYDALKVKPTATTDEIRKAYRKLVKTCHPDLFPGDKDRELIFKVISEAHRILTDDDERAYYDRTGTAKPPQETDREQLELIEMFTQIMMGCVSTMTNPATTDLIKAMRRKIAENRDGLAQKLVEASEMKIRVEAVRKRITMRAKGKENLLASILGTQINGLDSQIERGRLMMTIFARGDTMLNDYGYEVTQMLMSPDLADVYEGLRTGRTAYFTFKG